MKFASVVAMATAVVVSFLSGQAEAQTPISGFFPVRGPITYTNQVTVRRPVQWLAANRPDVYNMFLLALVRKPHEFSLIRLHLLTVELP